MARKQLLMELLQQGHYEEKAFYDGLSQDEREQKGKIDDWAAKDVIAHISYWKKLRVGEIQQVLEGGSATEIEDFDHRNAQIFEQFSDQSWEEVVAYAEEATAVMTSQLEKLSEAELEVEWQDEQPIWRIFSGNGYIHPLYHIAGVYQDKGDIQRAAEITGMLGKPTADLDDSPTWKGTAHYNSACSYSLLGNKKEALDELRQALELTPSLVDWSKQDPDLEPLRGEAAYQALYQDKE